jgi:hypothetical protein
MCSLKILRAPGLCGGALDCLSEREGRARVFVRLVGIVTDGITCWRAALGCVRWFGRCVLTVCDGLSAGVLARLRPHWEGVAAELALQRPSLVTTTALCTHRSDTPSQMQEPETGDKPPRRNGKAQAAVVVISVYHV